MKKFLSSSGTSDTVIILTSDDSRTIIKELTPCEAELHIINPGNIRQLKKILQRGSYTKLLVDADSFSHKSELDDLNRERYLKTILAKYSLKCLCMYEVNNLSSEMLKHLTFFHSEYQLTSRDLTLISGDSIKKPAISLNSLQKIVKDNLEVIILALLNRGAICGSDLIGIVHTEFNVLLSPGTIYPLLHSLYEKELVTWIKDGKEKKYVYKEDTESKIKRLMKEHIDAQKLLNSYLNKEMNLEKEVNQYIN